jgi:hypothetical protein
MITKATDTNFYSKKKLKPINERGSPSLGSMLIPVDSNNNILSKESMKINSSIKMRKVS